MFSSVISRAFELTRERGLRIIGASIVAAIPPLIVLGLCVMSLLGGGGGGATEPAMITLIPGSEGYVSTPIDPVTGAPLVGDEAATAADGVEGSGSSGFGIGSAITLLLAVAAVMLYTIISILVGISAASGSGVMEAVSFAYRRIPTVLAQWFWLTWKPSALLVVGVVACAVVVPLGLLMVVVAIIWSLFLAPLTLLSVAAIAHGDDSRRPDAVFAAIEGQRGPVLLTILGAYFVSMVLGLIPIIGGLISMVFIPAAIEATWEELGGTHGPTGSSGAPTPDPTGTVSPIGEAGAVPPTFAAAGLQDGLPAAIVPAALAAPVPGPAWDGRVTAEAPSGCWVELPSAARVGVQAAWQGMTPPALQLCDQAGTWRAPVEQPAASGAVTWIELPAGWTWVALTSRGGDPQDVRVATWLPAELGDASATSAA